MSEDVAQRIGQVVWPAVRASKGERALDALRPMIERFPPGGVIVFGEGEPHVERLIAKLRLRVGRPLLVSSDLERGCGQQVKERTSLPPAMALAANGDPEAAYEAGLLTGLEARECGIDVVYAPVVDVNTASTNPIIATRAFSDDPYAVAEFGSRFAAGLRDGGVLAVAKHFPGHGSTVQDSHNELARVTRDLETLEAVDLLPFRTLVAERVGGIMVGHLEVPALDPVPGRAATASPNVVLDHLRRRMGFSGLAITDALDMGGFRQDPVAALDVLQSGLDVLLMPADPLAVCEALADAYERRFLPDEVLDAACGRIAAARAALADAPPAPRRPEGDLGERLLAGSLTGNGRPLPRLVPGQPIDLMVFGEDDSGMVVPSFVETLESRGIPIEGGARPVGLVLTSVRAWAGTARLDPLHRRRLHWNAEAGRLDALVVLGSPYEMLELPGEVPAVLAYEATPRAAHQAALVLLGLAEAPGTCPVGAGP
ncbi:MAG: hypothetical protein H6825_01040 [Planctomycetes bacterium]|nr:hypothetical protein [Planctomycetota bacterium]